MTIHLTTSECVSFNIRHVCTEQTSLDSSFVPKKPRRSKSGGGLDGDTDYEFVELADLGSPLPPLRSPKLRTSVSPNEKDWIFPLPLTLEDIYHGISQHYRITRTLRSGQTQSVKINVKVSSNWRDGARVRVPGVGNEREDGTFQDIVFVVEEQPDGYFTRVDDDVHVSVQVPWADGPSRPYSLSSDCTEEDAEAFGEDEEVVYVKALDGREYAVPIPRSLVEAADGSRIVGAGMPIRKHGKTLGKGDLIIKYVHSLWCGTECKAHLANSSFADGNLRSRTPTRGSGFAGKISRKLCTGGHEHLCYAITVCL